MTTRKNLHSLIISAVAVLLVVLFTAGITAFAEEPATEAVTSETVAAAEAEETVAEAAAEETEAASAEGTEEPAKSNPLLNGILIVVVVGAVIICVREIHRDNHRTDGK